MKLFVGGILCNIHNLREIDLCTRYIQLLQRHAACIKLNHISAKLLSFQLEKSVIQDEGIHEKDAWSMPGLHFPSAITRL